MSTDRIPVRLIGADGQTRQSERVVPRETPVAVEFNGIGYAVMMMTPADLVDFITGFALSERLIEPGEALGEVSEHVTERGIVLRANLPQDRTDRLMERVRHRVSESSCGLCGIENLEAALRPLPHVVAQTSASPAAIFAALAALRAHQPLNRETGAAHAAALCAPDGSIRLAREDVGRHNAFDKLIGAMARDGVDWDGGFALLSARCSYELVEKAALANCPMLVTVSAPTALAVERARDAGLRLIVLARSDTVTEVG